MATEVDGAGPGGEGLKGVDGGQPEQRPAGRAAGPPVDAAARKALGRLTRRLAAVAPAQRPLLVAAVRQCSTDEQVAAVAEAAAQALLRSRSPAARAGYAATLLALGPDAGPAVGRALLGAGTDDLRAVLAEVAARVGPALPLAERVDLLIALIGAAATRGTAAWAAVAVARAISILRASIESDPANCQRAANG